MVDKHLSPESPAIQLALLQRSCERYRRNAMASWLTFVVVLAFALMQSWRLDVARDRIVSLQESMTSFQRSIASFEQSIGTFSDNLQAQNIIANALAFKTRTEQRRAGRFEGALIDAQRRNDQLGRQLAQCRYQLGHLEQRMEIPMSPDFMGAIDFPEMGQ